MPTDVLVIVVEFLAGDHAFGTLANLSLADRDIRDETLPVLYETVTLDNPRTAPTLAKIRSGEMPAACRYTK
jgi:hypothetical protein